MFFAFALLGCTLPLNADADGDGVRMPLDCDDAEPAVARCVAETASAAVAAMSIEGARPAERSVLARITADERRHAQLAWSAVAWMLATFPETREPMARAFADATVELERTDIGVQVARGVVSPCAEVLLG